MDCIPIYPDSPVGRRSLGDLILSLSARQRFSLWVGTSVTQRGLDARVPVLGFSFEVPPTFSSTSPTLITDLVRSFTLRYLPCYYVGITPGIDTDFVTLNFEVVFLS